MQREIIITNHPFAVNSAGGVQTQEFDLDKNIDKVIGLAMTSTRDDLLFQRGSQSIRISEVEVLREGHESRMLLSGIGVSPNERFFKIEPVDAGNHKMIVRYYDENITGSKFDPYRVTVYVVATLKQPQA